MDDGTHRIVFDQPFDWKLALPIPFDHLWYVLSSGLVNGGGYARISPDRNVPWLGRHHLHNCPESVCRSSKSELQDSLPDTEVLTPIILLTSTGSIVVGGGIPMKKNWPLRAVNCTPSSISFGTPVVSMVMLVPSPPVAPLTS
jgi:hypothetical protein